MKLIQSLQNAVDELAQQFDLIPHTRKEELYMLVSFLHEKIKGGEPIKLNFICTHNSRRSHIAQLWAQAAACYYKIEHVKCFSGGTEATAFNPRAVRAMQRVGFVVMQLHNSTNPKYEVRFSESAEPITVFSKKYDDAASPSNDFAAIMTCSHADEHCPIIVGASSRIPLTYDDPKEYDDTAQETSQYDERVRQIGREVLYAFAMAGGALKN